MSREILAREKGWILVDGIKLVRQNSLHDCGAAALAMMLQRSPAPASLGEILDKLPVDQHGIAAGTLRDFARARGLQAFVIKGEIKDLAHEISANRPVMVVLVQRHGDRAILHYEVVAGINPSSRRLFLLDPDRGLRQDGFDGFTAEWEPAGRTTLVIVPS